MAGNARQKLKLLYLKELFETMTDENNGVTMEEILSFLQERGITAERKSIYSDVEQLRRYGLNIKQKRDIQTKYMLLSREFELNELKLLADAVGSNRFITHKKNLELIKKLERLAGAHDAVKLHRPVVVDNRIKHMTESIYHNVDVIHSAIFENRQLQFKYSEYSRDRARVSRRDGESNTASPLALIYKEEYYYLAAWVESGKSVANFRVDRMSEAVILNEKRVQNKDTVSFNAEEYLKSRFIMSGSEKDTVDIMFHNSLSSVVLDRFGSGTTMRPEDADHFSVTVEVDINPAFFGWIFMFGTKAYISSPAYAVEEFAKMTREIADGYPDFS